MSKQAISKFQKRHYDAIVAIPSIATPQNHPIMDMVRRKIVGDLADLFAADNPRFDKTRFLTACKFFAPNLEDQQSDPRPFNPLEAV